MSTEPSVSTQRRTMATGAPGRLDQGPGSPVVLGQADREYISAGLGQGHRESPAQAGVAAGDQRVAPGEREQLEAEVGDIHRSAAIRGGAWIVR